MTSTDLGPLPNPEVRPTLTVEQAGRYMGLSRQSAYDAAARGDLPTLRVGRRLLVPTAALRRLLELDNPRPAA